ncbi:Tetratricopeptide repeat protein [Gemmata obscuriglobus]|uniref:Tetratricopeptide repeat protein n=1 Tax=Gemmata obscuriglobus TaxID=114 RepID=A0A2Z3H489_9BACT|nr:tetratricopeptide repeat protein [Gemmata obscuriglobus]AWM37925.1 tetratricopeptide repeat protein [Gemmata obscuriglobus]QEG29220.1 Tetratricopeptide repeat protein [Gemmata obscuriglobus]VTS08017.1 tetratricopeptide tpr_1 repeat-containing protein : Tetratricopeptide TPR_1 repeat-containing protein OS=Calothrix sp. PCC 6303 GN=Cal6303_4120 PE=4 SV=1: TPR_2: TPR_16 [Gemmata obscuriglobus UQM 2246]
MQTDRFARARILMEQKRYDLASNEITARIGDDPEDPEGYILAALCHFTLDRPGAGDAARRAVELAPNDSRAHFALSLVESKCGNLDGAEAAIRRAIELNSWAAGYFGQLAAIEIGRYDWRAALRAADEGLAIDPDDDVCLNHRAVALTKLGRHDEAAHTLEGTLEKHPEDAYTHANRGWTLLHENEPRKAVDHFREALRLDPNSEWAKAGLLEALRAKNWFYRRVLQFFLMLSRFSPRMQFGLIIGMVVVVRALAELGEQVPAAEPFFAVLIFAYAAFVAATWFAKHIINMLLLFDRDGRVLLDRQQKCLSAVCTVLMVVVLALVASAVAGTDRRAAPAAVFVFLVAVHLASVFQIPAGRFRLLGAGASALILGLFAYERFERFDLIHQFAMLQTRAESHDTWAAEFRARKANMTEEQTAATEKGLQNSANVLDRSLQLLRSRAEELNSWESVLGFASLGGLLLHGFLAAKAVRARFESLT